jgi:hypothetical protein
VDPFAWLRRENTSGGECLAGTGDDAGAPTSGTSNDAGARASGTGDDAGMPDEHAGKGADTGEAEPSPTVPRPVTTERIRLWCESQSYSYFIDNKGDLGGLWGNRGRVFFFLLLGDDKQFLQVRGYWTRRFTIERLPEVLELCNAWHVKRVWPVCYARVRDNGSVHITAEVSTDVSCGATDAQLDLTLRLGLSTATAFFDELDETYPDPAETAP